MVHAEGGQESCSLQLEGRKQSIVGMEQISRHHPIHLPTLLLLLVSDTGLEIYIIPLFFTVFEDLNPSSIWLFAIGMFWVLILLKAK